MSGLVATNENEDPHLTAIGHSYGSRTVGAATQQGGGIPGVDDIVLVGSPGVGVDHAEDLGVGKDHVFVGAAENDVVTKLPSKQQAAVGAVGLIAGGAIRVPTSLEILPTRAMTISGSARTRRVEAFGARRFPVDEGPRLISGDGVSIDAHSQYFDPERDAVSADSIALIAAGRSDKLKMEEHAMRLPYPDHCDGHFCCAWRSPAA